MSFSSSPSSFHDDGLLPARGNARGETCAHGHTHSPWSMIGDLVIEKCERYCWYCGIHVKNDAATLRKHVVKIHKIKERMPINVAQATSGRKRKRAASSVTSDSKSQRTYQSSEQTSRDATSPLSAEFDPSVEHVRLQDIELDQSSSFGVSHFDEPTSQQRTRAHSLGRLFHNPRDACKGTCRQSNQTSVVVSQREWDCMKADISTAHQQQAEVLVILYQLQTTTLYYQTLLEQTQQGIKGQELLLAVTTVLLPSIENTHVPRLISTGTTDHAWTVVFNGRHVYLNFWFKYFGARVSAALRDTWPQGKRRLTGLLGIGRHVGWAFNSDEDHTAAQLGRWESLIYRSAHRGRDCRPYPMQKRLYPLPRRGSPVAADYEFVGTMLTTVCSGTPRLMRPEPGSIEASEREKINKLSNVTLDLVKTVLVEQTPEQTPSDVEEVP
ncbi:hypothetical protein K491DRAFT_684868 [Lophiostoma macrostomum CBS 122681]|uniref:Uncharacterized protein n=1 Tax=Lophiostoma macrostomum CBS 122681 TaxID=1314788 RepID=A0A6A6SK19_9PLEO|nr:hypothetical protein K491DRAFT_684868 [Lophiostoma macrostomum CBS 122681]